MDRWLAAALDYIPRWIEFQMQASQQPGCLLAIAHRGKIVLERAFGTANLDTGEALTPRHRFRVASHSKSFTAAGIMKLREQGKLKLDDAAGHYRRGPASGGRARHHRATALAQRRPHPRRRRRRPVLRPPAVTQRGASARRPETAARHRAEHAHEILQPRLSACSASSSRQITGEPYAKWIKREIVDAAGLTETTPDMPLRRGTPFARGHSGRILLGRRLVIPGDYPRNAIGAGGRLRLDRGRSRALFRAAFAAGAPERDLGGEPARNDAPAVAQSELRHRAAITVSAPSAARSTAGTGSAIPAACKAISRAPASAAAGAHGLGAHQRDRRLGHVWVDGVVHICRPSRATARRSRKTKDWSGRFWTPVGRASISSRWATRCWWPRPASSTR